MEQVDFKPGTLGLTAFNFDTLKFERHGASVQGIGIASTGKLKGGWSVLRLEFGSDHWSNPSPVRDQGQFEAAFFALGSHRLFKLNGVDVLATVNSRTILDDDFVWTSGGKILHQDLRVLLDMHEDPNNLPAGYEGWYRIPTAK